MLATETHAWLVNTVISASIGVALGITLFLQGTALGWIQRYIDQILVIGMSLAFIKDPLIFMRNGLSEILLGAPQKEFSAPYEEKMIPLKESVGAKQLSLEVMKTGRRMWVTVRMVPATDTIRLQEFAHIKQKFKQIAGEIYENTDTEVILEAE